MGKPTRASPIKVNKRPGVNSAGSTTLKRKTPSSTISSTKKSSTKRSKKLPTTTCSKRVPFKTWIESPKHVLDWLSQYDLPSLVDENGGLVRVSNFLPPHIAEGIHKTLESIPEEKWNDTSAGEDYRQNNISHSFWSVKVAPHLGNIFRLFGMVQPGEMNTFSAAKYQKTHHIAPHDDRAYTNVRMDDGSIQICSRTLAVIYYLTRDWTKDFGGALIDHEAEGGPKTYVPEFNSVVAFRIPRYHEVTPMTTDRPRYTIFGWFLEPGKLYDLYRGENQGDSAKWNAPEEREESGEGDGDVDGNDDDDGASTEGEDEQMGRKSVVKAKEMSREAPSPASLNSLRKVKKKIKGKDRDAQKSFKGTKQGKKASKKKKKLPAE